jgi:predicted nucleic acid-binding protein
MSKNNYNLVISDANSVIIYTKSNKLDILRKMYKEVIITPDILDEYNKKSDKKLPEWVKLKEPLNKEKIIEIQKIAILGLGECSAIVLCQENPNSILISDDARARNYALNVGLNVIGTCRSNFECKTYRYYKIK